VVKTVRVRVRVTTGRVHLGNPNPKPDPFWVNPVNPEGCPPLYPLPVSHSARPLLSPVVPGVVFRRIATW